MRDRADARPALPHIRVPTLVVVGEEEPADDVEGFGSALGRWLVEVAGVGDLEGVSVDGVDGGLQRCVADQVRRIHFPSFSAPRMGARYSFGG